MVIIKTDNRLNNCDYRKKTNKGLLLQYQSHVDNEYKRSLLRTMIDRANRLSSSPALFSQERKELKSIFLEISREVDRFYFCQISSHSWSRQLTILFGSFYHLKARNLPTSCAKQYAALVEKSVMYYSQHS